MVVGWGGPNQGGLKVKPAFSETSISLKQDYTNDLKRNVWSAVVTIFILSPRKLPTKF